MRQLVSMPIRSCFASAALWLGLVGGARSEMPPTVADGAKPAVVFEDKSFFEGPTWDPKTGKLYFTSFKDKLQILRLDAPGKAVVWMDNSGGINGTYLAKDGRLLGARIKPRAVVSMKIGADGPEDLKELATSEQWNAPNDLCQTPRGDIYFTDPDFREKKTSRVHRIDTAGKVTTVVKDMKLCNGIIASLDGRTLYVADSALKHWRAYPIDADGGVGEGKTFFEPQTENRQDPDGMTIDEHGNLYFTGLGGVWAVSPGGKALGFIPFAEFCSNVTFGGAAGRTLYVTCGNKVYSLAMQVRGGAWAAPPELVKRGK